MSNKELIQVVWFQAILTLTAAEVEPDIEKLKPSKKEGSIEVVSDHVINACEHLNIHFAILFIMVLRHVLSPDGMLHGTMLPIHKRRLTNVSSPSNVRAITISSVLCKLLDIIIMTKERDNLFTSNLQFNFKLGASLDFCTGMVQDTISYYVNNVSKVYGLLLGASKAFDHVNYSGLYWIERYVPFNVIKR